MKRILLSLTAALSLVLGLVAAGLVTVKDAWAKKVVLEWKAIPGAAQYEIQVQDEKGKVRQRIVEDPRWKGDLGPGTYSYQIRGIDEFKRSGAWTVPLPLAVMPEPPNLEFPKNGEKLDVYSNQVSTDLKWEPTPRIDQYAVEVRRNGQIYSKTHVSEAHFELKSLPDGKYTWKVNPVLQADGRAPASSPVFESGKSWEGRSEQGREFEIRHKTLASPPIESPVSVQQPPDNGQIRLVWDEVDGAEMYEVRWAKVPGKKPRKREIAAILQSAKGRLSRDPHYVTTVMGEGTYVWGVRALANLDEKQAAQSAGLESVASFTLDRNAAFREDLGYLALSSLLSPYSYRIYSPINGFSGKTSSTSAALRLSAEFWLAPQWAIGVAGEYAGFQMNDQGFDRTTFELTGKYRIRLNSNEYGWTFSPKLGAEVRNYNFIYPSSFFVSNPSLNDSKVTALGAAVGLDIRKQFSKHFSIGAKIGYFYPVALLEGAGSGSKIEGAPSTRNLSAGIQGLYWLSRVWGLGVGGYFEMRSLSFRPSGAAENEETYMDGSYFFGSVIFRMWK